ncbi:kinase-like domain-containing protein [Gigaspora rosea]|uniref:Kinase-like domain-containing protein n=1 Tax=Gigaspora rosea TaxID=44941 RepID=A0A397V4L6_9GLOM|nr:kinase-like domain-containing protein [Gigaspora rosea]
MQYAKMGSLRQNLHKIAQMKWEKKLELLIYITVDLEIIHSHNFIHRDLHSGNIFQNHLYNAYIGDLGFATAINKTLESESRGAHGALAYMAPEILRGDIFTKASDIYSLGMIMWEISSGCVVFSECKYDSLSLAIEICEGLRPDILKSTPLCYAELLKRCWNDDQEKRATALEIHETILNWKNNNEILVGFLKSDDEMIIEYKAFDIDCDNSIYSGKFSSYVHPHIHRNEVISNNKSLSTDQNNADALRARGKVYFELGKYKESLIDLNRSLDIDPNNVDALEVRSKSLHAMEDIGSKEMMGVLGNILKSALNEGSFSSTAQVTKSIQQKLLNDKTLKQNQKKYLIDYLQKIDDEVSVHRQNGEKRQCEICKHSTHAKRYCEHCIRNYLRQHFKDWTSGNAMIDKIIQDCQQQTQQPHRVIEWIPFVNFKSVQRLTENSVYTAFWNNGSFANWNIEKQLLERHGGHPVTLKKIKRF